MDVARNALVAIAVGVILLGLAGGLVPFQEPRECSTNVEPAENTDTNDATERRYTELSPQGQAVFDRARGQAGSATVTGGACPTDFEYTAGRSRSVVEKDDQRYLVESYQNDLLPQDGIALASLVLLALTVTAIGIASVDQGDRRLPLVGAGAGVVGGGLTAAGLTAGGGLVWQAIGVCLVAAAGLFVGAGLTYRARRAAGVAVAAFLTAPVAAVLGVKTFAVFVVGVATVAAPVLVGIAFAVQYVR